MFKIIGKYAFAVAVFGVLGSSSFGSVADAAQEGDGVPAVTVRYADLNLNTPEGVEALYTRLQAAARAVCGHYQGRALVDTIARKVCYAQALSTAVNSVESETLNALHRLSNVRETLS